MNVTVQIHYQSKDPVNRVIQRGSFQSKGRRPEKLAFDWWNELKREMNVEIKLEKVIANGEEITEKVKILDKDKKGKLQ